MIGADDARDTKGRKAVVLANADRAGRRWQEPSRRHRAPVRRRRARMAAAIAGASVLVIIASAFAVLGTGNRAVHPPQPPGRAALPTTPGSYLGVYAPGAPGSYAGVTAFTSATRARLRLVAYYSGWLEPFQTSFATTAARHGTVPLVQIDPTDVSLAAIAHGRYDAYLTSYAQAIRAYRDPVILSFGHEMNAPWYSWGYRYTSPVVFVAAWRHIVTLFRKLGTRNVTWLWTVNVVQAAKQGRTLDPARWWPGSSYVTWVGIDGYYLEPSWQFISIFGPTIITIRELTGDPILIAETSATQAAGQPEKIANLFAGIHTYRLLGFVWFNDITSYDYRINGPEAIAAFRRGAETYRRLNL
jgi:Glycosyl hydrolase family 26